MRKRKFWNCDLHYYDSQPSKYKSIIAIGDIKRSRKFLSVASWQEWFFGGRCGRLWNRYANNIRARTVCPSPKFKFPGRLWRGRLSVATNQAYIYRVINEHADRCALDQLLAPSSDHPWSTDNLLRFKRRQPKRHGLSARPLLLRILP